MWVITVQVPIFSTILTNPVVVDVIVELLVIFDVPTHFLSPGLKSMETESPVICFPIQLNNSLTGSEPRQA